MTEKKLKIQDRISAVINYPDQELKGLVILCPGYLDTKDYDHLVRLSVDLSNAGYTAVRFDFTGTWESGGAISEYTISQQLQDVRSVLEYMLSEKKYGNIILGGHSRGGFISILYAIEDSRISAVLGIMSPYTLMKTVSKEKVDQWKKDGFRTSLRDVPDKTKNKEFVVPYSNIEEVRRYNILTEVSKLKVPLFLIAGEQDVLVSPEDVQLIFENASEPKKIAIVKGIGHDYRHNSREIKEVNKTVLELLAKNI